MNKKRKKTHVFHLSHFSFELNGEEVVFRHKKRPDVEMVVAYADIGFRVTPRPNAIIVENPMEGGITIQ